MSGSAREGARSFRRELARKAIHLTSATVPIALGLGIPRRLVLFLLGSLLVIAIAVEIARAASPSAASRFDAMFVGLLRAHESRRLTGATWLIAAMFGAVLLLPRSAAIAATWAAAVGDAAAALVGMRFGRHRSLRDGKSLEGSAACLLATLVGAAIIARVDIPTALLLAFAATIAERLPWPNDDNIRVIAVVGMTAMMAAAL